MKAMYLFTRRRTIQSGKATEAIGWSIETAVKAAQIAGVAVTPWTSMWGEDVGTVVWSAFVDDLAALEQAGDKLTIDGAFNQRIAEAEPMFSTPVVDSLAQIIHGQPAAEAPQYVSVVEARIAPGHFSDGLATAIEIAEAAERIGGRPTGVALATTGPYGGIAWMTGFPDIQALEAGEAAVSSDPSFVALVDRAGTCYQTDTQQAIYRLLT
jgi:hypothetical protein